MPIYEYECTNCGRITEAMQKFSDPPLTECGHCHGGLRKLISMSTFHLKGSGWYATDYAGKNPSTSCSQKSEEAGGNKSEGKSEKKSSDSSTD